MLGRVSNYPIHDPSADVTDYTLWFQASYALWSGEASSDL